MIKYTIGKVEQFNHTRGFGFIRTGAYASYFVHITKAYKDIKDGDTVTYKVVYTNKGEAAQDVRKLSETEIVSITKNNNEYDIIAAENIRKHRQNLIDVVKPQAIVKAELELLKEWNTLEEAKVITLELEAIGDSFEMINTSFDMYDEDDKDDCRYSEIVYEHEDRIGSFKRKERLKEERAEVLENGLKCHKCDKKLPFNDFNYREDVTEDDGSFRFGLEWNCIACDLHLEKLNIARINRVENRSINANKLYEAFLESGRDKMTAKETEARIRVFLENHEDNYYESFPEDIKEWILNISTAKQREREYYTHRSFVRGGRLYCIINARYIPGPYTTMCVGFPLLSGTKENLHL